MSLSQNFLNKMVMGLVSLIIFIDFLDSSILNVAIPVIAHTMHENPIDLKVALLSYFLALAMFIPISGRLADQYGQRNVFVTAIIIFTIGSIACGLSFGLEQLAIFRFIQGIGGALMVPCARLIIARLFPKSQYAIVMNQIMLVGLIGPMAGPLVGGFITDYFSWRWIFLVNVPFGVIAAILAWLLIQNDHAKIVNSFDKINFILFGSSLAALIFALSAFSVHSASWIEVVTLISVSIIGFLLYANRSKDENKQILDLSLLKIRTFKIAILGNLTTRLATTGITFMLPLLFQINFGFSPFLSGALTFISAFGAITAKNFMVRLGRVLTLRRYLIINTCLLSITLLCLSFFDIQTSKWVILSFIFLNGFFLSLQYGAIGSLLFSDVPQEKLSNVTSFFSTVHQAANSFGIAFSAFGLSMFALYYGSPNLTNRLIFRDTFIMLSITLAISSLIYTFLTKTDAVHMFVKSTNVK